MPSKYSVKHKRKNKTAAQKHWVASRGLICPNCGNEVEQVPGFTYKSLTFRDRCFRCRTPYQEKTL
jgi:hypothetical protein